MKAADVMTQAPISVSPDTALIEAARIMLQHRISGLPVTDGKGRLVGVVTEGDLLRRAETGTERRRSPWLAFLVGPGRLAEDYVGSHARKVDEVMTSEPACVAPDDDLATVVSLMEKRRVKRLPVVEDGRLVGIVSRADLVRALVHSVTRQAKAHPHAPVADEVIRRQILDIIDREPWGPRFSIEISVKDGVAELHGSVTDERERTAITVAAETIAGVKAVHDHLVWVEPTSGFVIGADQSL